MIKQMKKIINKPENFVNETIEGIVAAFPDFYSVDPGEKRAFYKKNIKDNKVAIVTGGGSGHLPLFLGYVGDGLADGCAVGNVFASPSAKVMYDVTEAVNRGAGVLYLFGNYGGDAMNFSMAAEMAEMNEISVKILRGNDDVASADIEHIERRRGIAGIFFAYKIAGAAADQMKSLDEVYRVTDKAIKNIRSMGIAISSCTLPEVGRPSFEIADDEMEIGMGIHGEPGIRRCKTMEADAVAEEVLNRILAEMQLHAHCKVAVLINGLGSTPREELFVVNRRVSQILADKHLDVVETFVGEYATSFEMGGVSISLMKLDEELEAYLKHPAFSPLLNTWR